ncbi:DUF3558 family protein [Actinosynnema pretiosum]|uniref:DUF3558 domain-containing protein n=1 Tax=Actinosynnema pretiosum TaxID=42197 RepID=A0A290Z2K6_9PSEU|nr:DUF3558 family protein [Actinosynnema pretiosum]ATE53232.1 hypothetical protein CNX65_07965 [Actinosynnema pretiosum]
MTKIRLAAAILAAAALTACSTVEPGNPSAASPQGSASGSTSASKPTSGSAPSDQLSSCEILTEVAAEQDLENIQERTGGAASTDACNAENSKKKLSLGLSIYPTLALADYKPGPTSKISDTTVGTRKAKLVKEAASQLDCVIAIEISPTSRADVFAYSINSLDEACATAETLAKAVEPSLPKG